MSQDNYSDFDITYFSFESNSFTQLEDAFLFDFANLSDIDSNILDLVERIYSQLSLSGKKCKEKKLTLNNFLTNLYISYKKELPIAIPKRRMFYKIDASYGFRHFTYANVKSIFDNLCRLGLIEVKNGFYNRNTNKGRYTRIQPSQLLSKYFDDCEKSSLPTLISQDENTVLIKNNFKIKKFFPIRPVILKDKKNKVPIRYNLTHKIKSQIDFLKGYNNFIDRTIIIHPIDRSLMDGVAEKNKKIVLDLFADLDILLLNFSSYNTGHKYLGLKISYIIKQLQRFTHKSISSPLLGKICGKYGLYNRLSGKLYRVYNNNIFFHGGRFFGAEYQRLNGELRRRIIINNNPISEIDYGSLHLSMLYHRENIDYKEDPYDIFKSTPDLRKIMKKVSLICINSESYSSAIKAINQLFFHTI